MTDSNIYSSYNVSNPVHHFEVSVGKDDSEKAFSNIETPLK